VARMRVERKASAPRATYFHNDFLSFLASGKS
jgi:hypothetical protein